MSADIEKTFHSNFYWIGVKSPTNEVTYYTTCSTSWQQRLSAFWYSSHTYTSINYKYNDTIITSYNVPQTKIDTTEKRPAQVLLAMEFLVDWLLLQMFHRRTQAWIDKVKSIPFLSLQSLRIDRFSNGNGRFYSDTVNQLQQTKANRKAGFRETESLNWFDWIIWEMRWCEMYIYEKTKVFVILDACKPVVDLQNQIKNL